MQIITRICCLVFAAVVVVACSVPAGRNDGQSEKGDVLDKPLHFNEAIVAAKEGDTDKSIVLFEKVIRENPDYSVAYTDLGLQYLKKKNMAAAEQAFETAISLNPSDFVAYNHRGIIKRMQGDFSGAKEMYKTAIQLNSDYANVYLNIAVLYDIYIYDLERAMQYYKKYQVLTGSSDKLVSKWIVDLQRRISVRNRKNN